MGIESGAYRAAFAGTGSGRSPWKRIAKAVLELAGPGAQLVRHAERPWASATFSGARHTFVLAYDGIEAMEQADDFIAALPDHEFTVAGRLVADATIRSVDQRALPIPRTVVEAELLVLDEA